MGEPSFGPQVGRPRARLRLGFVVALLVTLAAGVAIVIVRVNVPHETVVHTTELRGTRCTALDVERTVRDHHMSDEDRVVCLAVAGKIDRARAILRDLPAARRSAAVSTVFSIAHPIADAGDDRSAGPIMELVVEFQPENFMAVFHAGMAEFALGDDASARRQLERFLTMYAANDVWHDRAVRALADITRVAPLDQRQAHFPE